MLQPPGFQQHSITTSLGTMVYYMANPEVWAPVSDTDQRQPLVFLHGFGGGSSAYEWSKVYPAFAVDYRVIAPDLLGWGRSDHLTRNYQIDDYLTTLTEFIEQACDSPTTVVASSLTAAFAIRIAINRPDLFRSLILVAPAGISDFGRNYRSSLLAQLTNVPVLDRVIYSTGIATSFGIRNFLEQRQFAQSNRVSQEIVDAYLASAQQPNADYSALSFVRGDLCFDLANHITKLKVPTAILWGKQAQLTRFDIGERLMELNPQAIKALELLNDVGLTPQLELPAVTIALIQKYLAHL